MIDAEPKRSKLQICCLTCPRRQTTRYTARQTWRTHRTHSARRSFWEGQREMTCYSIGHGAIQYSCTSRSFSVIHTRVGLHVSGATTRYRVGRSCKHAKELSAKRIDGGPTELLFSGQVRFRTSHTFRDRSGPPFPGFLSLRYLVLSRMRCYRQCQTASFAVLRTPALRAHNIHLWAQGWTIRTKAG
jgi:hypothetical protein